MDKQQIIKWLTGLESEFEEEDLFRKLTLEFIDANDDFWQRSNESGQLTGSAWVLNPGKDKALMVHHRGLDKWFQPGGHAELTDNSLLDTSLREASEECGLQNLTLISEGLFDLDIHIIPPKGEVAGHLHYDFRFAFIAESEALDPDLAEVKDLIWVPVENLLRNLDTQQSIRRMAIKSLFLSSF
ncbi:MAG: NUDIX hydrolase [Saprospiraceae bacterium]